MGGKTSGSSAPTEGYTALAASNTEVAAIEQQTAMEQLQWSKDQYADQAPYTKAFMDSATNTMNEEIDNARTDRAFYDENYQPLEKKFINQANDWNSPARADQEAGAAEADVASQYDQARASATANLESYGIDPSQTRFAALDLGTRISQAAATAGAGTQSRKNTEATALSLEGEAINTGKGYASNVAQAYSGATQAGSSGVTAGLNTSSTYGNLMGTGTQWAGAANNTRQTTVSALNGLSNYELGNAEIKNAANASTWKTALSAVGTIAGAASAI